MYRAKPISQRDGSSLASSNCRMASISTGLDFHTLGKKTSTGRKMRSYTADQSGGTDAGDAKEAWTKGYSETLIVRDGNTFSTALIDLAAGHLVHLDVWHEASQGPCLSGTGRYGHSMAVAPERSGDRLLVADPWCLPGRWEWWPEKLLRAGAEEWGRRIRTQTRGRMTFSSDAAWVRALQVVSRNLMSEFSPDNPAPLDHVTDLDQDTAETGGPQTIMYTMTRSQGGGGDGGGGGGGDIAARFVSCGGYAVDSGKRINVGDGADWFYFDGAKGGDIGTGGALVCLGLLDAAKERFVVKITTGVPYADKIARDTLVMIKTTNKPYDAPVPPTPEPPSEDCDTAVMEAVQARDEEWETWLLDGAPSQQEE